MFMETETHTPNKLEKIITDPAETLLIAHHRLPLTHLLLLAASHSPVPQVLISLLSQAVELTHVSRCSCHGVTYTVTGADKMPELIRHLAAVEDALHCWCLAPASPPPPVILLLPLTACSIHLTMQGDKSAQQVRRKPIQ